MRADGLTSCAFGFAGVAEVAADLAAGTAVGFTGADSCFTGASIGFLAGALTGLDGGATLSSLTGAGSGAFAAD